ncbi:PREDICTED: chymotrypsin-1-like [Nicrophorus vespilloides]|uniref:Chymotrypsin-1-like n=1 Tax=Nicrophorus vespilloides TaxID=110193 RepID=A0ABM1M6K7_NICVS|nr:PREDICTED: chymotrypsin-1-like [Nicrophorus vespilloides]
MKPGTAELRFIFFYITKIPAFLQERIVNGSDAHKGEFPYIVSLQRRGRHICAGSILDEKHILTAAHCVYRKPPSGFTIQYGTIWLGTIKNIIDVEDIIVHEDYDPYNGHKNDIAILKLEDAIEFSDDVQPTVLPKAFQEVHPESESVLAGWGYEKSGGRAQRYLQRVNLVVFSNDECEDLNCCYADRAYHLCSGVHGGGKGQCSGDSGGPLYSNDVQVGIVSWSIKPCASRGHPGVFTKVAKFVRWINQHTRN